jgi:tetratricopeptide (TPR) repeat protein
VLPFENLTGDPSLDWAGPAMAGMFAAGTSASARVFPMLLASSRDAVQAQAGRILRGYFERRGDKLRFYAVAEDMASHRNVKTYEASGPASSVAVIAEDLEKETKDRIRPFGTQIPDAIRYWGESMLATVPTARAAALQKAIQADKNFGTAYAELARLLFAAGDRDGAARVVAQAHDRLARFTDVDRARVELVEAELKGNAEERRRSMVALSRLISTDPQTLASLGDLALSRREFTAAADYYKNALALLPDSYELLNQLGYVEAYRNRIDDARAVLERYRSLQPEERNPLDSLGEVHFIDGHFAEAEKYFLEAQSRAPGAGSFELVKAAQSRLMQGNIAGADELFQRYIGPRQNAHDPRAVLESSQWFYLTGRRKQALAALEGAASMAGDAGAFATAQLSLWRLGAGDAQGAKTLADRALQNSTGAAVRSIAALCQFLAEPRADAAALQSAAESTISNPEFRDLAVAYAMLYARNFPAAVHELKPLYEKTSPAVDGPIRTLYAWALVESGKVDQAAPLVEVYPTPLSSLENPFNSLVFPRFLAVRAAVREKQGRKDEANSLNQLYNKLSGPGAP